MKKPLFCFFYLFIFSGIFAQEKELEIMAPFIIEGIWTGKLTQVSGGIAREYAYEITISLKDSLISGMGTIKTGTSYANFDIKGKLIGSKVDLEDIKISNEKPNGSKV